MTGQEHYAEAERLLSRAMLDDGFVLNRFEIAVAQAHATLALAAAQAEHTAYAAGAARALSVPS